MSIELRFLEGNWKFGKFKLQYREGCAYPWEDVQTFQARPEKSLEEKFEEWMSRNNYGVHHNAEVLASIAEAHFTKKDT